MRRFHPAIIEAKRQAVARKRALRATQRAYRSQMTELSRSRQPGKVKEPPGSDRHAPEAPSLVDKAAAQRLADTVASSRSPEPPQRLTRPSTMEPRKPRHFAALDLTGKSVTAESRVNWLHDGP